MPTTRIVQGNGRETSVTSSSSNENITDTDEDDTFGVMENNDIHHNTTNSVEHIITNILDILI